MIIYNDEVYENIKSSLQKIKRRVLIKIYSLMQVIADKITYKAYKIRRYVIETTEYDMSEYTIKVSKKYKNKSNN